MEKGKASQEYNLKKKFNYSNQMSLLQRQKKKENHFKMFIIMIGYKKTHLRHNLFTW